MTWTKEELKDILQYDFIENPKAFTNGRRNDDMVDSMCICFALDEEWTEMYAKHCDNFPEHDGRYYDFYVREHYERVKNWLDAKEDMSSYNRGEDHIMVYAINY